MYTTIFATTEIEQLYPSLTAGASGSDAVFTAMVTGSVVAQQVPLLHEGVVV